MLRSHVDTLLSCNFHTSRQVLPAPPFEAALGLSTLSNVTSALSGVSMVSTTCITAPVESFFGDIPASLSFLSALFGTECLPTQHLRFNST